jgi:hypothetical protein
LRLPGSCMELLLNLAWLLLALPAWWVWRASGRARVRRNFSAVHCLLVLGCVLVILFPVVSATDDLCAMRAEIEESPASKRGIRPAGNEKPSVWHTQPQTFPPQGGAFNPLSLNVEWADLRPYSLNAHPTAPLTLSAGRAPPASYLR